MKYPKNKIKVIKISGLVLYIFKFKLKILLDFTLSNDNKNFGVNKIFFKNY